MPSDQVQDFEQGNMEIHRPMPRFEDIFPNLNGAKQFSTLDLHAGYHHIPLDDDSILKTAFTSPLGKYDVM